MDRDEALALLRERIVAFAASRTGRTAAEDLAQDVLVVLEEKYREVTEPTELVPLAMQILRFRMASWRRRQQRRGEASAVSPEEIDLADPGPGPEAHAQRQELLDRLTHALPTMGERCRELFRLKLLGRSFAEIAEEMDAGSINTVYTWDLRCRKRLMQLVGGKWEKR
jgi:RNA polymerase sigma-70 factor (ECF subfamily)